MSGAVAPDRTARRALRGVALFAGVFGVATSVAAARALFGHPAGGASEAIVPFVAWFDFIAGFAYVAAAFGLALARRWSVALALALAVGTAVVFAVFGLYVAAGGAFQTRTVYALGLRTSVWVAITLLAAWLLRRRPGA
ncbi:MAG: hypothetical protein OHK0044_09360 [Burkholderiaceae bacterium]